MNLREDRFVKASFLFIEDLKIYDTEKPYYINGTLPEELKAKRTNLQFKSIEVPLEDIRFKQSAFSLARHGFTFVVDQDDRFIGRQSGLDDSEIQDYLERMSQLLKEEMSAEKVLCYDVVVSDRWYEIPSSLY